MKYIFCLFFFPLILSAQNDEAVIKYKEVYGLRVMRKEKLISRKMSCGIGLSNTKCNTLYEIEILEVLFLKDTSVFSKNELEKVRFFILPKEQSLNMENEYELLAGNSSTEKYLVGFRLLEVNTIKDMLNVEEKSIYEGLVTCSEKQNNKFINYILKVKK